MAAPSSSPRSPAHASLALNPRRIAEGRAGRVVALDTLYDRGRARRGAAAIVSAHTATQRQTVELFPGSGRSEWIILLVERKELTSFAAGKRTQRVRVDVIEQDHVFRPETFLR